jgi:hypothetical protein
MKIIKTLKLLLTKFGFGKIVEDFEETIEEIIVPTPKKPTNPTPKKVVKTVPKKPKGKK